MQWFDKDKCQGFGSETVFFKHNLLDSGLFTDEKLGELIENYPREHYNVTTMSKVGEKRTWRDGELGPVRGTDVMEAIRTGQIWLSLRHLEDNSPELKAVLDSCYKQLQSDDKNFTPSHRNTGLLISSPTARVHTHADIPVISLWHLRGRKRVWLYDGHNKDFLPDEKLEAIMLKETEEEDLPYHEGWDKTGQYFDMEPGDVLAWPQNAPHRVDNLGGLNVSLTSEFHTPASMKKVGVYYFNGLVRRKFGIQPKSTKSDGVLALAKSAVAFAAKKLGVMEKHQFQHRSTFVVDPASPSGYRDFDESEIKTIKLA